MGIFFNWDKPKLTEAPPALREVPLDLTSAKSKELITARIPSVTAGVDQSRAACDTQLQAQQQQQHTTNRPGGPRAPNSLNKPRRNKGRGEESPVELTPTREEQLLGALLKVNIFSGKPDEVSLMTSTSSLIKMTHLYPTRLQKPSPDPKIEVISRSIVMYGTEYLVSHGGTSQYNRSGTGASACGLAALNFARIALSMQQSGLQDTALLQAVLGRECAEVRRRYSSSECPI